jgi:hypothetical protein
MRPNRRLVSARPCARARGLETDWRRERQSAIPVQMQDPRLDGVEVELPSSGRLPGMPES